MREFVCVASAFAVTAVGLMAAAYLVMTWALPVD